MKELNIYLKDDCCETCLGKGSHLIRTVKLYDTCKKCNGDGKKPTWLQKIFGKGKYKNNLFQNNIEILLQILIDYCNEQGYHFTYHIKKTTLPTGFKINNTNIDLDIQDNDDDDIEGESD